MVRATATVHEAAHRARGDQPNYLYPSSTQSADVSAGASAGVAVLRLRHTGDRADGLGLVLSILVGCIISEVCPL